jgi:hypothetical protein
MKNLIALPAAAMLLVAPEARAQQAPAIRQLGPVIATSKETFGAQVFVRHAKNGVLVNDVQNRRLLLLDPTLSTFSVVADTTPATANAYSGRTGGLIGYRADSSLFVDAQSMSMLVIDPEGKVARVMSVPRSQDAPVLGNSNLGSPAFDAKGRLIYRPIPLPDRARMMQAMAGGPPPAPPESAAVIGVDLGTRQVDTIAFTAIPKVKMDVQRDDNGRMMISAVTNPLPTVDDWAVLTDGSIAIVRGRDYHIDWIRPDGAREATPKLAFEWKRLSDEDKVAFLDSVKAARERMAAQAAANGQTQPVVVGGGPGGPGAGGPGAAGRQVPAREGGGPVIVMGGGGPGGPNMRGGAEGQMRAINLVQPSELPDYYPPFFAGSSRPDADGNLWIRTTQGTASGFVYDVVNAKGQLIDRVQAPKDRTIVGFGPGRIVYLAARDGNKTTLEKASVK